MSGAERSHLLTEILPGVPATVERILGSALADSWVGWPDVRQFRAGASPYLVVEYPRTARVGTGFIAGAEELTQGLDHSELVWTIDCHLIYPDDGGQLPEETAWGHLLDIEQAFRDLGDRNDPAGRYAVAQTLYGIVQLTTISTLTVQEVQHPDLEPLLYGSFTLMVYEMLLPDTAMLTGAA